MVEVVASIYQGRTAAAQCGLFTYKSVPVIFEPPCILCISDFMYRIPNFMYRIPNLWQILNKYGRCWFVLWNSFSGHRIFCAHRQRGGRTEEAILIDPLLGMWKRLKSSDVLQEFSEMNIFHFRVLRFYGIAPCNLVCCYRHFECPSCRLCADYRCGHLIYHVIFTVITIIRNVRKVTIVNKQSICNLLRKYYSKPTAIWKENLQPPEVMAFLPKIHCQNRGVNLWAPKCLPRSSLQE